MGSCSDAARARLQHVRRRICGLPPLWNYCLLYFTTCVLCCTAFFSATSLRGHAACMQHLQRVAAGYCIRRRRLRFHHTHPCLVLLPLAGPRLAAVATA